MDWGNLLHGAVPFMLAAGTQTDKKVNRVRIVESVVSAVIIALISTIAAAYVTVRIVEYQTAQLTSDGKEQRQQVLTVLTQMATVQATLAGLAQQQDAFAREMHERIMAVERREAAERNPRAR